MEMVPARRRVSLKVLAPALLVAAVAAQGCDIVTAELRHTETAEWRKTYDFQPGGRVEIVNVNGKIEVEPSTGNSVEVVAKKSAKGATPEAAKENLNRVEIVDSSTGSTIRVETKVQRGGWMNHGGANVTYTVKVPANAEQMIQVFIALLINAADAMNEQGVITLRTRRGVSDQEAVIAEVIDEGSGIPRSELTKIFEPFYTTKPAGRGTGLGLSVCYSIVAAHNGRIEVDSAVGAGTTFRVMLPNERAAGVQAPGPTPHAP